MSRGKRDQYLSSFTDGCKPCIERLVNTKRCKRCCGTGGLGRPGDQDRKDVAGNAQGEVLLKISFNKEMMGYVGLGRGGAAV